MTFVSEFGYDTYYKRLKAKKLPNGEVLGLTFNQEGYQLTSYDPMTPERDFVYTAIEAQDVRGNVTRVQFGNSLIECAAYHAATGRLKTQRLQRSQTPCSEGVEDANLVHEFRLERLDPFANLTRRTRKNVYAGGASVTRISEAFEYDHLRRLTKATRSWIGKEVIDVLVAYAYDKLGNLKRKTDFGVDYVYGDSTRANTAHAGPHAVRQVVQTGGQGTISDFRYDERGNMISGMGRMLTYNAFNKPTAITEGSTTTTFSYDPNGALYKKDDGNQVAYYVTGDYEYIIEGATHSERAYLTPSILIHTTVDGTSRNRDIQYASYDHLDSLVTMTNQTGHVVSRHGFDAFGKPLNGDWEENDALLSNDLTDRGFTAHQHLDNHQLIHMGGRVHDPVLGRFLSVDPVITTHSQALNSYSYVMNNPLSYVDPTGYCGVPSEQQFGQFFRGVAA